MNLLRKTYLTFAKSENSHEARARNGDVVQDGYLARPSPAGPKKRWAALHQSGLLRLYQSRASPVPYQELNLQDFNSILPNHSDNSFVLRSTAHDTDHSFKFITCDAHSQRAWVAAIKKVFRSLRKADHRSHRASFSTLRDSIITDMNSDILNAHQQAALNDLLERLEQALPTDPITAAQSSGEPVALRGYLFKRGSINPSFKLRWFVLTELGRMIYFANNKASRPLGQVSLAQAELVPVEDDESKEFAIKTNGRQWLFRCETHEEQVDWVAAMNRVFNNRSQWSQIRQASQTLISNIETGNVSHSYAVNVHDQAPDVSLRPASVKVAIVSWNLAERFPDMEHLSFLRDLRGHDIIVVGVQEFQPVIATVGLSAPAHHHTIWEAMVASMLGPRYGMPGSCAMGAVHVAVFTRRELLPTFSNLQTSSIACGIGNVLTNKGAVAVKFNICDVSVCFTCAHLCCGTERVMERNNDFTRVDAELPQALLNLDRVSLSHFIQTRKATYKQVLSTRSRKPRKARSMSIVEKQGNFRANALNRSPQRLLADMVPLAKGTKNGGTDHFNPVYSKNPASEMLNPVFNLSNEDDPETTDNTCRMAVCFDFSFFLGDLNYRISADGAWLRYMLRMAEQLETLEALTKLPSPPLTPSDGQLSPTGVEDSIIDTSGECAEEKVGSEARDSRELKMAVLLNAISTRELRSMSNADGNSDTESEDEIPDISDSNSDGDDDGDEDDDGGGDSDGGEDKEGKDEIIAEQPNDSSLRHPPQAPPPPPPPLVIENSNEDDVPDHWHDERPFDDAEFGNEKEFDAIQVLRILNIFDASETAPRDSLLVSREQLRKLASDFAPALKFVHRTGMKNAQAIYSRLLQADQLIAERQRGAVFSSFEEAQIMFKPSYKFDKYTQRYDTGKKNRAPAWCDRIMFTSNPLYSISPDRYFCVYDSCHSDHRPVIGTFTINLSTSAASTPASQLPRPN